jgi:hypothetical protein
MEEEKREARSFGNLKMFRIPFHHWGVGIILESSGKVFLEKGGIGKINE